MAGAHLEIASPHGMAKGATIKLDGRDISHAVYSIAPAVVAVSPQEYLAHGADGMVDVEAVARDRRAAERTARRQAMAKREAEARYRARMGVD